MEQDFPIEVRGRDIDTGLPQTFILKASEIREAIEQPLNDIITSIYDCLTVVGNEFDNEFAEDLVENGIHLAGGGSLLRGLDARIHNRTQIPVKHVEKPLECVVRGAGIYIGVVCSEAFFLQGRQATGTVTLRVMPQLGITQECLPAPPTTKTLMLSGLSVIGALALGGPAR